MYYRLSFNLDDYEKLRKNNAMFINAKKSNMNILEFPNIKKGFFDKIIYQREITIDWPKIIFYYNSDESSKESDFLFNIKFWPIIHKRVIEKIQETNFKGLAFYPIELVDEITNNINSNYYLMYTQNFIDAYDMQKSKYYYNEEYDFYTFIPRQCFLNQEVCSGYDVFRCEKSPATLFVSDEFKQMITENNFTNFSFDPQL